MGVEGTGEAKRQQGIFHEPPVANGREKKHPFVGPSIQGPTSWPLCLRVGPSVHRAKSEYEFAKEVPLTLHRYIHKKLFMVICDYWSRYLKWSRPIFVVIWNPRFLINGVDVKSRALPGIFNFLIKRVVS